MFDVIKWNMLSFLTLKRVKNEFSCRVYSDSSVIVCVHIFNVIYSNDSGCICRQRTLSGMKDIIAPQTVAKH